MSFIGLSTYHHLYFPPGSPLPSADIALYDGSGARLTPQGVTPMMNERNGCPLLVIAFGSESITPVFVNHPSGLPVQLFRVLSGNPVHLRNAIDGQRISYPLGTLPTALPLGECAPPVEDIALWHEEPHADGWPVWVKDLTEPEISTPPPGESTPMSNNVIQLKRRLSGDIGAPAALVNGELAFNEVGEVLYYGFGADNDGNAVNIIPIGGKGAYLGVSGNQTVAGIKTFSGELHVSVPTLPTQAANKGYVDAAVSQIVAEAITGAFHYVGELDATTNTLPTAPVQGDLYRITAEGNFADATAFIVSAGDFVVWNGAAWDKIDNTDPTLAGTDGRITVTRTGENAYVVDLDESYAGGTQLTRLGTVTEGVWNASILSLAFGGTGADLSNASEGVMFKKMGNAFVPAIAGTDYVKTNVGTVNGGTF